MLVAKALHLIFMVTWFAGLFYLPRLYVYHAMSSDEVSNERFKIMERKLFYGITTPGAVLTIAFGLWIISYYPYELFKVSGWLHLKLLLIALLVMYHIMCGYYLIQFKYDRNKRSHIFYRWFNEVPVVFLIVIIFLAVLKPF